MSDAFTDAAPTEEGTSEGQEPAAPTFPAPDLGEQEAALAARGAGTDTGSLQRGELSDPEIAAVLSGQGDPQDYDVDALPGDPGYEEAGYEEWEPEPDDYEPNELEWDDEAAQQDQGLGLDVQQAAALSPTEQRLATENFVLAQGLDEIRAQHEQVVGYLEEQEQQRNEDEIRAFVDENPECKKPEIAHAIVEKVDRMMQESGDPSLGLNPSLVRMAAGAVLSERAAAARAAQGAQPPKGAPLETNAGASASGGSRASQGEDYFGDIAGLGGDPFA